MEFEAQNLEEAALKKDCKTLYIINGSKRKSLTNFIRSSCNEPLQVSESRHSG
ncbi:unnamed protein product [Soboliphyme baturini]|uniref:Uncharacterized protein n=1 Tax=Soboliphyme baturini TaxID=241478 RepID=A0A183JA18_9BILA|nr:unnamed protein product [Soboliphyme baturini]